MDPLTMALIIGGGSALGSGLFGFLGANQQANASKEATDATIAAAERQAQAQRDAALVAQSELGRQYGYGQNYLSDANRSALNLAQQAALQQQQTYYEQAQNAASQLGGYTRRAYDVMGQGGQQALGTLGGFQSQLGQMLQQGYGGFAQDPGYQFRQQQGEQAIGRAASAMGGRASGRTLKALTDYNQNLASQEFGNYANRQNALMGYSGQADAQQLSRLGQMANINQLTSGQQAGMLQGLGGQLYQHGMGVGSNLSNMQAQAGNTLANMAQQQGLTAQQNAMNYATNYGNIGIGAAGNAAQTMMSAIPAYQSGVPYAGAGWGAAGNTIGQLGTLGMMYAMSQGQPAPSPGIAV